MSTTATLTTTPTTKSDDDECTACNINSSHSVFHLFDCPAHPTTLTTKDLWENPRDVADHLRSMAAFDNIPAPATPPRRRLPARPPTAPPDPPTFSPISLPPSPTFPPRVQPLMLLTPPPSPSSSSSSSPLRGVNL